MLLSARSLQQGIAMQKVTILPGQSRDLPTSKTTWFEQPTNEETRICLRLEDLFARLTQCLESAHPQNSYAAIITLSQLCNATDRNDLSSKLYKLSAQQLERMEAYAHSPAVDLTKLNELITAIRIDAETLKRSPQKPGDSLRQNPFFNSVRQQLNSPNGLATFDSPQYCLWVRQSDDARLACLHDWLNDFELLHRIVKRSMDLIRSNCETKRVVSERGLFEQPMDKSRSCQLVRVKINGEPTCYPTISVGKHQINIQLLKVDNVIHDLPQKYYAELPLTLHFCY